MQFSLHQFYLSDVRINILIKNISNRQETSFDSDW